MKGSKGEQVGHGRLQARPWEIEHHAEEDESLEEEWYRSGATLEVLDSKTEAFSAEDRKVAG